MKIDFEKEHTILYSGPSLTLGKIHWHILRAITLIKEDSFTPEEPRTTGPGLGIKQFFSSRRLTDFGRETISHEIHWWIYQVETDHNELKERSLVLYEKFQHLRNDARELKTANPESYSEIVKILKQFTDSHEETIELLGEYVNWLAKRDPRAPCILFSKESKWSASEMSDRTFPVQAVITSENPEKIQYCVAVVLGLKDRLRLTAQTIFNNMDYDLWERLDPEIRHTRRIDQKLFSQNTAREVFEQFELYVKRIRDSLESILQTIERFESEPFVIRNIFIGTAKKKIVRFGLVQLQYSLKPKSDQFGCEPENAEILKGKILSAIQIAKENQVDFLVYPELCMKKEWIEEMLPLSENMIIVAGSYYDNASNICPVVINGQLVHPEYLKINPSIFEGIQTPNGKMKSGKFVYIYETELGRFSVLTCIDFANIIHSLTVEKPDFVINPCYDPQIQRFQKDADVICRNHEITIIQANRTKNNDHSKYGRSSIFSKEHQDAISRYTVDGLRENEDPDYLIAKIQNEGILIADVNFDSRGPTVSVPPHYQGRTSFLKIYRYEDKWIESVMQGSAK